MRCHLVFLMMMMMMLTASTGLAGSIDLDLNDDAARFSFGWSAAEDRLNIDAAWLHHEDNGDVASLGLHLVGEATSGSNPLRAGIGGRVLYLDPEKGDGQALAIGGYLDYSLPMARRVGIGGGVYYAPDVLAGGGAESYSEWFLRVGYNIVQSSEVYLGYRRSKGDFDESSDVTFDSSMHLGIRLEF